MLGAAARGYNSKLFTPLLWLAAAVMMAADAPLVPSEKPPESQSPVVVNQSAITAPDEFRAIYLSYWSAATASRVETALTLAREGLINAVVIDVKDVKGTVAFDTKVALATEIGAKRVILRDLDGLLNRLHAAGLYVIARQVVFSDPKLAEAQPHLGIHSASKLNLAGGVRDVTTLWRDRRDLAWIDPAAFEAWHYNIAIAQDALSRGFDEINFDYIRFPSDGALPDMRFPIWEAGIPRHRMIRTFFSYLRSNMGSAVISGDLFGLSTVKRDDLGIGQVIEDALEHFDYVCPMVYPSLYASGFIGKKNPADFPYEVVFYSMNKAQQRLGLLRAKRRPGVSNPRRTAKLRPWLQEFHTEVKYTPKMVEAQVRATRDSLGEAYHGFMLWSPRNVYQRESLTMMRDSGVALSASR